MQLGVAAFIARFLGEFLWEPVLHLYLPVFGCVQCTYISLKYIYLWVGMTKGNYFRFPFAQLANQ